jgi:EAL domain-containing protein (putative c-di-GMP-specific phosphodiesterase class I)
MSIVAEGIEDHESLAILKSFGIGYGQGYLFSQPVPAPAIMAWMDAFDRPVKAANIIPLQRANINGR